MIARAFCKVEAISKTSQSRKSTCVFCHNAQVRTKDLMLLDSLAEQLWFKNLFAFVSMQIHKNSNFSVSRSDFDSRRKPGVSISWMEFGFGFAIENSRSFKTVICSMERCGTYTFDRFSLAL